VVLCLSSNVTEQKWSANPVTELLIYAFGTCDICKVSHISLRNNDRSARDKCALQGAMADINAIQAG
jgi:hypothetical protein